MTLSRDQMRTTLLEHVEAENANDPDIPSGRRYVGGEQIVGNYRQLWDGFPGLTREISRWTFDDDSAVIELTLRGRHEGRYRGGDPTDRDLVLKVIAHFQFDSEGRIQQETAYYDSLTVLRALGRGDAETAGQPT
jgi:steroid delta-isomerase-like uncharacterized protein